VKPGRRSSRRPETMAIPGRCSRWGCLVEVGPNSTFGSGPVCLICTENLRPVALSDEENERWKRATESP